MRIVMLTRYGFMGASSRYRLLQYIPLFEQAGHKVDVLPLLNDAYVEELYSTGRRSRFEVMRGYLRRLGQLAGLSKFDLILCEQEFFPYLPFAADRGAAQCCARLIVDYDDAAYFKYRDIPLLKNRVPALMARAEAVVVGNRHLQAFASRYSNNVHVIPTVVDVTRYATKQDYSADGGVKLVWIGTPVTAEYLKELAPIFLNLKARHPSLKLHLIGAGNVLREILPFATVLQWSEATESRLLAECDIGIMPLPDNGFTRGKCGLKLIQCMAAGLPVVGSSVGANCDIITEGVDGFLADSLQSWSSALERLIAGEELRHELGLNASLKAATQYSLERGYSAWMRIISSPDRSFA